LPSGVHAPLDDQRGDQPRRAARQESPLGRPSSQAGPRDAPTRIVSAVSAEPARQTLSARVAELADAPDLGASSQTLVSPRSGVANESEGNGQVMQGPKVVADGAFDSPDGPLRTGDRERLSTARCLFANQTTASETRRR